MLTELKRGLVFTVVMMALMGGAYHGLVWAIGRAAFPVQAEGSLIRRADGTIVGSRLVAQKFTREEHFRSRPSAVDYNAASTGGSNYGPSNPEHLKAVGERLASRRPSDGGIPSRSHTSVARNRSRISHDASRTKSWRSSRSADVSSS